MNVGQLLETHWGWVAQALGCTFLAPPFERVRLGSCSDAKMRTQVEQILACSPSDEEALERLLDLASGRVAFEMQGAKKEKAGLYLKADTKESPDLPGVVVGYQYFMKLNHLVEDKIHAREQGEYSLITDQPVKGRRRGGGQRLGEMEVWAIEAHDVPHLLQECLTLRSDDVCERYGVGDGRLKKGRYAASLPESFRATVMLLRGLGLKLELKGERYAGFVDFDVWDYWHGVDVRSVQALRLSIATPEDIRRWSRHEGIERPVKDTKAVHRRTWYEYHCPDHGVVKGDEGVKKTEKRDSQITCPECDKKARSRVCEERAYTPKGLFGEEVFGRPGSDWRERMAFVELAAPVINPVFERPLSRLLQEDIEEKDEEIGIGPWLRWQRVRDCKTRETMPWQSYELNAGREVEGGAEVLEPWLEDVLEGVWKPGEMGWSSDPTHAILRVLPVIPPDFRRMFVRVVQAERASDLHHLYTHVLRCNSELQEHLQTGSPARFVTEASRRLQLAVNALFVEGKEDLQTGRRLCSLGDLLKGKEGLFRHALLGKRVDYSGRSVIVADPDLELNEFRLPERVAAGIGKRLLTPETKQGSPLPDPEAWKKALDDSLFLLNRAPTLHRYNVLAFKPKLTKGLTVGVHPLMCGAFNADFDGDTMAVHFPLLPESQEEMREKLLPTCHFVSIASGRLLLHLTQDVVSGIYRLTGIEEGREEFNSLFGDRILDPSEIDKPVDNKKRLEEKGLEGYVSDYFWQHGPEKARALADGLMRLAFESATFKGLTLGVFDIPLIPYPERVRSLGCSPDGLDQLRKDDPDGYEKKLDDWKEALKKLCENQLNTVRTESSLATMVLSGARGDLDTAAQLGAARGLMKRPGGGPLPPVLSNFREGLSPMEFFISSFGARKTMVDKKMVTASAGHLTRLLVEAAYPLTITNEDCGTREGIPLCRFLPLVKEKEQPDFMARLVGRVPVADVRRDDQTLAQAGEPIPPDQAQAIAAAGVFQVIVRSPFTCKAKEGVCQKCYGWDLSRRAYPEKGLPVGIIAGQSIGERGTQLTFRTFHSGGVRGEDITSGLPRVKRLVEGWVDMPILEEIDGSGEVISGTEKEGWRWVNKVRRLADEGKPMPTLAFKRDGRGRVVSQTMRLKDAAKALTEVELCHAFLWEMHRVYKKGEVNDRHFEVILRAMRSPSGALVGVSRAVFARKGFLARASFQRALDVLAEAAVTQEEDSLRGPKERLMLGKLMRQVKRVRHSKGEASGRS